MANTKRIMICLPAALLEEVDVVIGVEKTNRSQLIREAMRFYLHEKQKSRLREEMRRGYQEMARINLLLAQEAFNCEEEASYLMERRLMERW